jgi:hypothetical protein
MTQPYTTLYLIVDDAGERIERRSFTGEAAIAAALTDAADDIELFDDDDLELLDPSPAPWLDPSPLQTEGALHEVR